METRGNGPCNQAVDPSLYWRKEYEEKENGCRTDNGIFAISKQKV